MVRDLSTTHSQIVQTMNLTESLGHLSLLCHKRFGNGLRSLANVHVLSKSLGIALMMKKSQEGLPE